MKVTLIIVYFDDIYIYIYTYIYNIIYNYYVSVGVFSIDVNTGAVTLSNSLDRETTDR